MWVYPIYNSLLYLVYSLHCLGLIANYNMLVLSVEVFQFLGVCLIPSNTFNDFEWIKSKYLKLLEIKDSILFITVAIWIVLYCMRSFPLIDWIWYLFTITIIINILISDFSCWHRINIFTRALKSLVSFVIPISIQFS